jgi:hypothetical protein
MSVAPTAWVTADARSDLTTSSTRAEESITTGVVALGGVGLGLQAQGGGDLGFPLGPGGANLLR